MFMKGEAPLEALGVWEGGIYTHRLGRMYLFEANWYEDLQAVSMMDDC